MKKNLLSTVFLSLLISSSTFADNLAERKVLDLKTIQFEKLDRVSAESVEVIKSVSKKEIGLDDKFRDEVSEKLADLRVTAYSNSLCNVVTGRTYDDSKDIIKKGRYTVAASNVFSNSLSILLQSEDSNVNSLFIECYSDTPAEVTLQDIQNDLGRILKFNQF